MFVLICRTICIYCIKTILWERTLRNPNSSTNERTQYSEMVQEKENVEEKEVLAVHEFDDLDKEDDDHNTYPVIAAI